MAGPKTKAVPARPYHHGDLRQALLTAAVQILELDGVGALSLREVARRAGVSHAAPYHHFADKDAILAAVAEDGFRALRDQMRAAEELVGLSALKRLQATGTAYVDFALRHPSHFRLMFSAHLVTGTASVHQGVRNASLEAFGVLHAAVERAIAAGGRTQEKAMELALAGWSIVHGLATLWLDGPLHHVGARVPPARELAERFTELCIRGAGLGDASNVSPR